MEIFVIHKSKSKSSSHINISRSLQTEGKRFVCSKMNLMSRSSKTPKRTLNPNPNPNDSRSAETVENDENLLVQILVRLPIKHLLRFKCVSKRWLSIITHPEFCLQVSSNLKSNISGLFLKDNKSNHNYDFISLDNSCESSSSPPFRSLCIDDHPTPMTILQSCNGLLLCHCSCGPRHVPNYYVYNPTTKQRTFLPPFRESLNKVYDVCLAFDPSKSPHYKVFCIRNSDCSSEHYEIEVYSSHIGGPWRISGPPFLLPYRVQFSFTVFCNNAVHWFGYDGYCVSYDIEKEKFSINRVPISDEEEENERFFAHPSSYRYFGESRGQLNVVHLVTSKLLVYEMQIDGSGWHRKYEIDLECLAVSFPEMKDRNENENIVCYHFSVLCVVNEENEEESYAVLQIPDNVIRFNFKDKSFKKLDDSCQTIDDDALEVDTLSYPLQFIESLACV